MSPRVARQTIPAILGLILVGAASVLRAQDLPDQKLTPYQEALLHYENGEYPAARTAIDAAEKAKPGDPAVEILKARILTEQLDFADGEKLLRPFVAGSDPFKAQLALGDLLLRKRDFGGAAKYYELASTAQPGDHDITLKLVYARVGATDLVAAEKLAVELKPFAHGPVDPKNPSDPCYYFARAAIAQATGDTSTADDEIEAARTLFGISFTNSYLKTYLEVTAPLSKNPPPAPVSPTLKPPAPAPVPAGPKP